MERRKFLQGMVGGLCLASFSERATPQKEKKMPQKPCLDVKINIIEVKKGKRPVLREQVDIFFSVNFPLGISLTSDGFYDPYPRLIIGYTPYRRTLAADDEDNKHYYLHPEVHPTLGRRGSLGHQVSAYLVDDGEGIYFTGGLVNFNWEEIFQAIAQTIVESQGKSYVRQGEEVKENANLEIVANQEIKQLLRLE